VATAAENRLNIRRRNSADVVCGSDRLSNNRDLRGLRKLPTSDRPDGWIESACHRRQSRSRIIAPVYALTSRGLLRLAIFTPTLRPSKKAQLTKELAESDRAGGCNDSSGPTADREPPELQQPAICREPMHTMRQCVNCGNHFQPKRRDARFCQPSCRDRWYKHRYRLSLDTKKAAAQPLLPKLRGYRIFWRAALVAMRTEASSRAVVFSAGGHGGRKPARDKWTKKATAIGRETDEK
jgi:hypothetical protein